MNPGHVIAVDSYAIREWSVRREVKSHHFKASYRKKVLFLAHVQSLECYMIVTVPKRIENEDGTKNQPVMQLWSYSLTLMQEVSLYYICIILYCIVLFYIMVSNILVHCGYVYIFRCVYIIICYIILVLYIL